MDQVLWLQMYRRWFQRTIKPFIDLYPLPNNGVQGWTTPFANRINDNYGQIRLDQNISASDTLFGRYTIDWAPGSLAGTFPEHLEYRSLSTTTSS